MSHEDICLFCAKISFAQIKLKKKSHLSNQFLYLLTELPFLFNTFNGNSSSLPEKSHFMTSKMMLCQCGVQNGCFSPGVAGLSCQSHLLATALLSSFTGHGAQWLHYTRLLTVYCINSCPRVTHFGCRFVSKLAFPLWPLLKYYVFKSRLASNLTRKLQSIG